MTSFDSEFHHTIEDPIGNICYTCHSSSIERQQFNEKNSKSFQSEFHEGLTCSICKRTFICSTCIVMFDRAIQKDHLKHLHVSMHPFVKSLRDFVLHSHTSPQLDNSYIGHCCVLKNSSTSAQCYTKQTIDSPNEKNKYKIANDNSPVKDMKLSYSSSNNKSSNNIKLGGCFVYECCRVIVPSCFKYYDCMALAKEENLDPIPHLVLDEKEYSEKTFKGTSIHRSLPKGWTIEHKQIVIRQPYNNRKRRNVSETNYCLYWIPIFL